MSGLTPGIISEVITERGNQDKKFGIQKHSPADWLMILGEEYGEACKAALEEKFKFQKRSDSYAGYRAELIQCAAVAIAAVECLDNCGDCL